MREEFDNKNRGVLFRNDDKREEKDRDYSGTLNVEGAEYWVSAWLQTSRKGTKYLSLSLKPKVPLSKVNTWADDPNDKIGF